MRKLKKWLLKKYKVKLNIPLDRVKVGLRLKLHLQVKGDGEPILYNVNSEKSAIEVRGKYVIVRNFNIRHLFNGPEVSFIEE